MKKPRSKKHHYLPSYYLKGFTDDRNFFFIYDKKRDKILPNALTPDTFFFENNLNTVILMDGSYSDFLEDFYTQIEETTRNSLNIIRTSTNRNPIQLIDMMNLFLFLSFLHWRLPSNSKYCEELSKKFFNKNYEDLNFFSIKNKKDGKTAPKEIIDRIKNSKAFKKTAKLIIPLAPFRYKNWADKIKNWRFLYTGDEEIWDFVGDNPIITSGNKDHDPVKCLDEFIFPVSGKALLININRPVSKDLPPQFTVEFNASIIERAQRFVACQNKPFLESLIDFYRFHVKHGKTHIIIPELFKTLEN